MGLIGPYGKEGKGPQGWPHPSPWSGSNWTREGGRPLPSFSFSLPLFLFHMGGGILLGLGSPSRTPHLVRPLLGPASSSLAPLYTGAGGHPMTHKLIYGSFLSRVWCPPSTIFHLGHIVAEFRRRPAPVEHHHRHHAVVLTELIPEALLDRSPGIVIELNVC